MSKRNGERVTMCHTGPVESLGGAGARGARRPWATGWLAALGCGGLWLVALAGACDSTSGAKDETESCELGARRDCDCDADHSGVQSCRGDGLDYLPCDCTSEPGGARGAGGGGNSGGGSAGSAGTGECADEGASCQRSGDCCSYPDGACVDFSDAPRCAASCSENTACDSGCCAVLDDYTGACAEAAFCGEASACREDGTSCDESADCCGFDVDAGSSYCLELDRGGPGMCSPRCDGDSDCESECCLPLENSDSACFPAEDCG